ncbi:MAG: 2-hydroxyacyl-CoA dehydratase [Rhizobiaceae bacterium]
MNQAVAWEAPPVGTRRVAFVGNTVPVELIGAAGCTPVWVRPDSQDQAAASGMMEADHEPETRALFSQICAGDVADCDLLVIAGTSDGYRFLFQYLKEEKRQGNHRIPPLHMFDLLYGDRDHVRRYTRDQFSQLARRLSVVSGRRVTDAALQAQIASSNARIARAIEFAALRAGGSVPGPAAHAWTHSLRAGAGEKADAFPHEDSGGRAKVMLVPSEPLYQPTLHDLIEEAGARVIAEDDWCGTRGFPSTIPVTDDPSAALCDWYRSQAVAPRMLMELRSSWFREQIASGGFSLVVFYVPPHDHFFGWEVPFLIEEATRHGVPHVLVRQDIDAPEDRSRILSTLRAAVAGLAPNRAGATA